MSKARIVKAKEEIHNRLAARRAKRAQRPLVGAPRYDDVFFGGLAWLNELATED